MLNDVIATILLLLSGGFLALLDIRIVYYCARHEIEEYVTTTAIILIDILIGFLTSLLALHLVGHSVCGY